jgi:phosphonate transport system ATP-binding protein
MTPILELRNASAGYAGRAVLRGIDLSIEPGERIAVLGRSGAGKSTLLNLIYERIAAQVALIPQAAALVKSLSVYHNVFMGRLDRHPAWYNLRNLAWPNARDVAEIRATLDLVDLRDKIFAKAGALSGGQQQRTSVARALYNDRNIVIGDEPVSALDRVQGAAILEKLCSRHETSILAMHDIPLALSHARRILVIEDGAIVLDSPSKDLKAADLMPYFAG